MPIKFVTYIKDCFTVIKRALFDSKTHFYICLGALCIALLIALSKDYSTVDSTTNFIFVMISGNASPIPHFLKLTLWLVAFYALLVLSSTHFISYLVFGYLGIGVTAYLVFIKAFQAIAVHPLSGFIYLLLYLIPSIIIVFVGHVCALREIYKLLNYKCNRKCIINLGCHFKSIKKAITPIWLIYSIIILAYWLIFYLILLIFV